MNPFCNNIKFLRKSAGLTIKALAKKCDVPESLITNIEKAKVKLEPSQVISLSDAFDCPVEKLFREDIEAKSKKLSKFKFKFLVLDVDGVMTDGGMYVTEKGDEFKKFNTKDGLGIIHLIKAGHNVGIISSGFNKNIVESRAKLLGIKYCYIGTWNKLEILEQWCKELKISLKNVAYIGDDLNDMQIFGKVGLTACPSDAVPAIKAKADIILSRKGGDYCVREFIDSYLSTVL
jgi:3-deoxy-D-manno-octulosonate 8-phosphate phosphatase (KDO 8-P phosphatase)